MVYSFWGLVLERVHWRSVDHSWSDQSVHLLRWGPALHEECWSCWARGGGLKSASTQSIKCTHLILFFLQLPTSMVWSIIFNCNQITVILQILLSCNLLMSVKPLRYWITFDQRIVFPREVLYTVGLEHPDQDRQDDVVTGREIRATQTWCLAHPSYWDFLGWQSSYQRVG